MRLVGNMKPAWKTRCVTGAFNAACRRLVCLAVQRFPSRPCCTKNVTTPILLPLPWLNKRKWSQAVVVHALKTSSREAEAGISLSSRVARARSRWAWTLASGLQEAHEEATASL